MATIPNSQYSYASPRRQLFSLPVTQIYLMLSNPSSPKGLAKLYQTCKYFYGREPILFADHMKVTMDEYTDENPYPKLNLIIGKRDVSDLRIPIWLTGIVHIEECWDEEGDYANQQQFPKLFRYSVESIILDDSFMNYENFVLLTSEKRITNFETDAYIYYAEYAQVPIEEILKHLPNIQVFNYFIDERCSLDSLRNLNKIKFNKKFIQISLEILDIHWSFDFNLFSEFIVNNTNAETDIQIAYCPTAIEKLVFAFQNLEARWMLETHRGFKKFLGITLQYFEENK